MAAAAAPIYGAKAVEFWQGVTDSVSVALSTDIQEEYVRLLEKAFSKNLITTSYEDMGQRLVDETGFLLFLKRPDGSKDFFELNSQSGINTASLKYGDFKIDKKKYFLRLQFILCASNQVRLNFLGLLKLFSNGFLQNTKKRIEISFEDKGVAFQVLFLHRMCRVLEEAKTNTPAALKEKINFFVPDEKIVEAAEVGGSGVSQWAERVTGTVIFQSHRGAGWAVGEVQKSVRQIIERIKQDKPFFVPLEIGMVTDGEDGKKISKRERRDCTLAKKDSHFLVGDPKMAIIEGPPDKPLFSPFEIEEPKKPGQGGL